jgi:hypothetical protein
MEAVNAFRLRWRSPSLSDGMNKMHMLQRNNFYQRRCDGAAGEDLDLGDVVFLDHGKDAQGGEKEEAGAENDESKEPIEKWEARPLIESGKHAPCQGRFVPEGHSTFSLALIRACGMHHYSNR